MSAPADSGLLVRRVDGDAAWTSPHTSAYSNEEHLQSVIAAAPERVPGVPDGSLAVRELSTSAGAADVCIVAPDGSLTVVECKLASNSERRRMVIGQVLDYASAIRADGEQVFYDQWARHCGADLNGLPEGSREQLSRNIADGRIHLCLAVDRIDADLRRLVEYLNQITHDEIRVTALQLAYARHDNLEILIPSTYGGEIAAAKARSSDRAAASWTREAFLDALTSPTDWEVAIGLFERVGALEERLGTHDDLWFGGRPGGGIFFHPYGLRYAPFQLWINTRGQLMGYGNWRNYDAVRDHPGFAELAAFVGQDHTSGAKGFAVASIDVDRFWNVAIRCAFAVNEVEPPAARDRRSPAPPGVAPL